MTSGIDPNLNPESENPYSILGLSPSASFEDVQKAREKRLAEVGDDPKAKARIEASYDSVLMSSLKQRQLGNVSNAAASASQKEVQDAQKMNFSLPGFSLFNNKPSQNSSLSSAQSLVPQLALSEGSDLIFTIVLGAILILILILSNSKSVDLILAVSLILTALSLIRRGRKILSSLGWSVVLLSIGLMIGSFLVGSPSIKLDIFRSLSHDQIQSIPAMLALWLGALLLA